MINTIFLIVALTACGKAVVVDDDRDQDPDELLVDGSYAAILFPINGSISTDVHGDAYVVKYGDEFRVKIELYNAPKGRVTQQLHTGSTCPQSRSDINDDGLVDGLEARRSTGPMIVPFDGDLSTQHGGENYRLGLSYRYIRSSSYSLMLYDLHLPDETANDDLVKLSTQDLSLERRAVSLYLRSSAHMGTKEEDIPLACGILTRISDSPIPEDSWEDESETPRRTRQIPRRPDPRPEPESTPQPEPRDSWWDRFRDR